MPLPPNGTLIASYPCTDGSGTTVSDQTGNELGLTATLGYTQAGAVTAAPTWIGGIGTCLGLDFSAAGPKAIQLPTAISGQGIRAIEMAISYDPAASNYEQQYLLAPYGNGDPTIELSTGDGILSQGDEGSNSVGSASAFPVEGAFVLTLLMGPTGSNQIFVNGVEVPYRFQGPLQLSTTAPTYLPFGRRFQTNAPFFGKLYYLNFYSSTMTSAQVLANSTFIQGQVGARPGAPSFTNTRSTSKRSLVFMGDSICFGQGITGQANRWACQVWNTLGRGSYNYLNTAIIGRRLADVYTDAQAAWPKYVAASGANPIAVIEGGINDFVGSATASGLYTGTVVPFVAWLKAHGASKVICCTVGPYGGFSANAAKETERTNYNALVLANSAGADAIARFDNFPGLITPADANTNASGYLQADKLHPSATGTPLYASAVLSAINSLISTLPPFRAVSAYPSIGRRLIG